jgi:hypothetical protein
VSHKSEEMMQTCLANEWKAQVKPEIPVSGNPDEYVWKLFALRGKETLAVTWTGNKLTGATYTYGEHHRLTLTWRNQVAKLITGKPNPRRLKGTDTDKLIETRYVPWDKDTPNERILAQVSGCTITYVRTIDREVITADVPVAIYAKHFRIIESPPNSGRKVLEWVDPYGFRAVRLDSIIDVS